MKMGIRGYSGFLSCLNIAINQKHRPIHGAPPRWCGCETAVCASLSYRKQHFKPHGEREMPSRRYDAYRNAEPYFDLVRGALGDLVEGEHFFDIVAEDIGYEVLYDIAGWPRVIRGSADLMTQFRGYCDNIELQSADNL